MYQDKHIIAGLPLYIQHKYLWQYSYQPPFSQPGGRFHPRLLTQKQPYVKQEQLFADLICPTSAHTRRPPVCRASRAAIPAPVSCGGYSLSTRYSYQIAPGQFDTEKAVTKAFARQHRRKIKDLPDAYSIVNGCIEDYLKLLPHAGAHFQRDVYRTTAVQLMQAGMDQDAVALLQMNHLSPWRFWRFLTPAIRAYTLVGLMHERHRKRSPMTALYARGIWHAQQAGRIFDFEGAMQPDIAYYFSRFGGTPVPYINLRRKCLTKLTWPSPSS